MPHIAAFIDAIASAGLTPPTEILDDGKRHRFSSSGKPKDDTGWYILHGDDRPAGAFGCWRSGISVSWKHDAPKKEFSAAERAAWKKRIADVEAERAADLAEASAYAAAESAKMWAAAREDAAHEYLARKRIPGMGARVLKNMLLIPVKHSARDIVGVQRIWPDGTKRPVKGTPMAGAYTTLGTPTRDGTVVICEGYATGVSIHMATGYCVVVAFFAGNLAPVAAKITAALPSARVVIASDDDVFTVRPENHPMAGQPWNPGLESAIATGLPVILPVWAGERERDTDFNDLHLREGLDAVRACFDNPAPLPEKKTPEAGPAADTLNHRSAQPASGASVGNPGSVEGGARLSLLDPADPDAPGALSQAPGPDDFPLDDLDYTTAYDQSPVPSEAHNGQLLPALGDEFAPDCSDDDLAARHLRRLQKNTLWCEMWGRWLVWNGDRWLRDETNMVLDAVRQSCRFAANVVLENPELDPGKRQRQADKIASFRTIQSVERLSRTYRAVATHPDEWDRDLWALNTPGGVVDLRTGAMRPHASDDRFTKITAVAPAGDCPTWLTFLQRATAGNDELIGFLKRMCGYALTGEVREHALFFVYGTGGNGKGTFLNTITHIMADYQRVAGAETFTESPGDRHTTELARLHGARLVTAQETEEGKRWAESRIKALTGGDPITARYMRQDDFTFLPQFKLVIVGNHKPSFRSVDDAIKRRLHLVPFTAIIPASEKDPLLSDKLKAEAPAILKWMIEGCLEWERDGLRPPAIVKESTEQYLGAEDSLQQWIDESCQLGGYFEASKVLFYSWSKWCESSGEFVGTMKRLMAKLESRGIKTGEKSHGLRGVVGIRIKRDDEYPL